MYWYWNPPIITSISLFFMMLSLIDYSVPRICSCISQPHQWTASNGIYSSSPFILTWSNDNLIIFIEKKFEIICETLVKTQDKIYNQMTYFIDLKRTNPKMVIFLSLIQCIIDFDIFKCNLLLCFIFQYFLSLFSFCSLSAWIGYTVNNWLICFILGI